MSHNSQPRKFFISSSELLETQRRHDEQQRRQLVHSLRNETVTISEKLNTVVKVQDYRDRERQQNNMAAEELIRRREEITNVLQECFDTQVTIFDNLKNNLMKLEDKEQNSSTSQLIHQCDVCLKYLQKLN